MSLSKNLGQVSGVFIGKTPPVNTSLIWYDDTPSQMCHKVFDKVANTWKALSPDIVSNITYSELVLNAQKNGLCIGKHYNITDKSNVLALAITETKVQYYDASGNILIDDLGTNIQYHVGSSDLLIDDLSGVFNTETNKLVFEFKEETDINIEDDYLFGKSKKNGKWFLSKFCFKSLISKKTDNSISWRKGIFFSLKEALNNMINKSSGVVGYDDYSVKMTQINKSITDISKDISTLNQNLSTEINNKTKDSAIYNKKIQNNIDTLTAPADVILGDTLHIIVSKFQRWINRFKYATGILISKNFKDASSHQFINNNDTVESAFSKIQYSLKNIPTISKLADDWKEIDFQVDIENVKGGDSLDSVIKKIIAKLRQIGNITPNEVISNGVFKWRSLLEEAILKSTSISFNTNNKYHYSELTSNKLSIEDNSPDNESLSELTSKSLKINNSINKTESKLTDNGVYFTKNSNASESSLDNLGLQILNKEIENYSKLNIRSNNIDISVTDLLGSSSTTLSFDPNNYTEVFKVVSSNNMRDAFDAYFGKLKIDSLNYNFTTIPPSSSKIETYYIDAKKSFVLCKRGMYDTNIYLPSLPKNGTMIIINIGLSGYQGGAINVLTQGRAGIITNIKGDEFSPIVENNITFDEHDWGTRIFMYMDEFWHYLTMKG